MLKLLFAKINENAKPRTYLDFTNDEFYLKYQSDYGKARSKKNSSDNNEND